MSLKKKQKQHAWHVNNKINPEFQKLKLFIVSNKLFEKFKISGKFSDGIVVSLVSFVCLYFGNKKNKKCLVVF